MAKKKVAEEKRNTRMITQQPPKQANAADAPHGMDLLNRQGFNKHTASTKDERNKLGLHGLLPPRVESVDEQVMRAYEAYKGKDDDLERHIYLRAQDNNEVLFYMLLLDHIEETRLGVRPADVHRPIPESPGGVHPKGHRGCDDQSRGATDHRPRGDGFRFQSRDGFPRKPTCSLEREEIKDGRPSQTSTVGPCNSGAKKALVGETILVKAVEGGDAIVGIFAMLASVRNGRYALEHKLDERTTFLWWNRTRPRLSRLRNGHPVVRGEFDVPMRVAAHRSHNLTDAIESLPSGLHRPEHKEHHDVF